MLVHKSRYIGYTSGLRRRPPSVSLDFRRASCNPARTTAPDDHCLFGFRYPMLPAVSSAHRRKPHALLPTHHGRQPSLETTTRSGLALAGLALCLVAGILVVVAQGAFPTSQPAAARAETGHLRVSRLDGSSTSSRSGGDAEPRRLGAGSSPREERASTDQTAQFVPSTLCGDERPQCTAWQRAGECERNPRYMHSNCAASCGLCYTYAYGINDS
jgi:hypothetical protein